MCTLIMLRVVCGMDDPTKKEDFFFFFFFRFLFAHPTYIIFALFYFSLSLPIDVN